MIIEAQIEVKKVQAHIRKMRKSENSLSKNRNLGFGPCWDQLGPDLPVGPRPNWVANPTDQLMRKCHTDLSWCIGISYCVCVYVYHIRLDK